MPNLVEIILRAKNEASKELKDVDSTLGNLSKTALKTGGIMMAAGGAVVGAAIGMVKATANLGDELNALSERTGIAVETLSEYKHVADISEGSLEGLARGLKLLAQNMYAAERGGGEQIKMFRALNVDWRDGAGQLKGLDAMLEEIADSLSKETDATKQAAIAVQIFGRGGLELLPMLKLGSAGIKALRQEAHELGITLTTEQARAGDLFNDNLKRMKEGVLGLAVSIGNQLMPQLTRLEERIINTQKSMTAYTQEHKTLAPAIMNVSALIAGAGGLLVGLGLLYKVVTMVRLTFIGWTGPIGLVAAGLAILAGRIISMNIEIEGSIARFKELKGQWETLGPISEKARNMALSLDAKGLAIYPELYDAYLAAADAEGILADKKLMGAKASQTELETALKTRAAFNDLMIATLAGDEAKKQGLMLTAEEIKALEEKAAALRKVAIAEQLEYQEWMKGTSLKDRAIARMKPREEPYKETREVPPLVTEPLVGAERMVGEAEAAFNTIKEGGYSVGDAIVGVASGMTNAFSSFFTNVLTGAQGFGAAMKGLFSGIVNAIISELAKLAALAVVKWLLAPFTGGASLLFSGGGKIAGAAKGGKVGGYFPLVSLPAIAAQSGGKLYGGIPGRDSVPILGMPGEVILPTRLVTQLEAVFSRNVGGAAQAGGRVQRGGEVHNHYHFDNAHDWASIRRAIRSGEFGQELALARTRGDI